MNLRHIWVMQPSGNDQVGDTPAQYSQYGCPTYPHLSTCSGKLVEMTMNYMDYTDDACMYMFTTGQKTRMRAIFCRRGARNSFAQTITNGHLNHRTAGLQKPGSFFKQSHL